jgi:hypothetical protein
MTCNLFRCFHTLCGELQMGERHMDVLRLTLPLTPVSPSSIPASAHLMLPTSSTPACFYFGIGSRTYADTHTQTHKHIDIHTYTHRH